MSKVNVRRKSKPLFDSLDYSPRGLLLTRRIVQLAAMKRAGHKSDGAPPLV